MARPSAIHSWKKKPLRKFDASRVLAAGPRRCRLHLEQLEDRQLPSTFLVTTTADTGPGSLRQAILEANAQPGHDQIAFQIAPGGVQTITPLAALPSVSDPVTLDGWTQPGYAGRPLIELNGSQAGTRVDGLRITAGNSTVRGLVVNGFDGSGIALETNGGNHVAGNFIGTDVTGTTVIRNWLFGVRVTSNNNLIGGTTAASRNLIAGSRLDEIHVDRASGTVVQGNYVDTDVRGTSWLVSGGSGIHFFGGSNNTAGGLQPGAANLVLGGLGLSGRGHLVQGNYVGTDVTGTRSLGLGVSVANGSSDILIGGTVPGARNVMRGLAIRGAATNNVVVQGNYVGVDVTGTVALGSGFGVSIENAFNNLIGGTTPEARNLISGNGLGPGWTAAVQLFGSARLNRVQGNYIGTDVTGTVALPNGRTGVAVGDIGGGGNQNLIGGTEAGAGNLISGNTAGLFVGGTDNIVQGNFIGTDVTGTVALPNQNYGVSLGLAARRNLLGGSQPGARNLIAGSRGVGLGSHDDSTDNVIQGNFIGTDVTGTRSLPNLWGVVIRGRDNLIGGTEPGAGNLISGNTYYGLGVAVRNVVQGNRIGTDVTGTQPLGNGTHGVSLVVTSLDNLVGGAAPGAANVIAFNGQDGIHVDQGVNNALRGNRIFGHRWGLGIRLLNGGNREQVAPELTSAIRTAGRITVTGTLWSEVDTPYAVELFASAACHPSGSGEGEQFLGAVEVTTDAAGRVTFTATFETSVPLHWALTATATDPAGNTSAFSACQPVRRRARPLPLPLLAQTVSVPYRDPGATPGGGGLPALAVPAGPEPEMVPCRGLPELEEAAVDAAFAPVESPSGAMAPRAEYRASAVEGWVLPFLLV